MAPETMKNEIIKFNIAIQPDELILKNGSRQSYSDRWISRARELGHEVRIVDVFQDDITEQLRRCDGFMWRFPHPPFPRLFAKRLLAAAEQGLGLVVFPDWKTVWHHDDKIAQGFLLKAAGIPTPKTYVFWKREDAMDFCRDAQYPLVLKLAGGASSQNVKSLKDFGEAEYWINQMFSCGVFSLQRPAGAGPRQMLKRLRPCARLLLRGRHPNPGFWFELQRNYLLVQEFLPGNPFDTRVIVVGNRAWACRRYNRPNDFRASGSGLVDFDTSEIEKDALELAFYSARHLSLKSVAFDVLRKDGSPVISEISYSFPQYKPWRDFPGYWKPDLTWVPAPMWPEDAIMVDFLADLTVRTKSRVNVEEE